MAEGDVWCIAERAERQDSDRHWPASCRERFSSDRGGSIRMRWGGRSARAPCVSLGAVACQCPSAAACDESSWLQALWSPQT